MLKIKIIYDYISDAWYKITLNPKWLPAMPNGEIESNPGQDKESPNHDHSRSSAHKFKGKLERNGEDKWREGVAEILPLLSAKWKKIACIVNHQPIYWAWGWQPKSLGVLTFHPGSEFLSFCIFAAVSSGLVLFILFGIYTCLIPK